MRKGLLTFDIGEERVEFNLGQKANDPIGVAQLELTQPELDTTVPTEPHPPIIESHVHEFNQGPTTEVTEKSKPPWLSDYTNNPGISSLLIEEEGPNLTIQAHRGSKATGKVSQDPNMAIHEPP